MSFATPVSLHGRHVSLVPLAHSHHDDLAEALKDGELWTLWYTKIPAPGQLRAEIARRLNLLEQGSMVPFAVIEKSTDAAVGMTTFMNIDAPNRRVEIGSTWYRKRVQRSAVNTECKMLLQHPRPRVAHGQSASRASIGAPLGPPPERDDRAPGEDQGPANQRGQRRQRPKGDVIDKLPHHEQGCDVESDHTPKIKRRKVQK